MTPTLCARLLALLSAHDGYHGQEPMKQILLHFWDKDNPPRGMVGSQGQGLSEIQCRGWKSNCGVRCTGPFFSSAFNLSNMSLQSLSLLNHIHVGVVRPTHVMQPNIVKQITAFVDW
jgi:hypothetical protein